MFKRDKIKKRILMSIIGVLMSGVAVGFFKCSAFGVDPYQTLVAGLYELIPISFGTLYVIMNAVGLMFALIFDRHYIGIATFINMFFLGYVAQYSQLAISTVFPEIGITGRIICLIIGVGIICVGASLYVTADLGVSTYDAVALIITYTWHKGQFKYVRITSDLVCVILGALTYFIATRSVSGIFSIIGVGTIITAFFMGPLIDFFNRKLAEPLLNK